MQPPIADRHRVENQLDSKPQNPQPCDPALVRRALDGGYAQVRLYAAVLPPAPPPRQRSGFASRAGMRRSATSPDSVCAPLASDDERDPAHAPDAPLHPTCPDREPHRAGRRSRRSPRPHRASGAAAEPTVGEAVPAETERRAVDPAPTACRSESLPKRIEEAVRDSTRLSRPPPPMQKARASIRPSGL